MNVEKVAKMLSKLSNKEVVIEFVYQVGPTKNFNVVIDKEIMFDVVDIGEENLTPTFLTPEEIVSFSNSFYPDTFNILKSTYSELHKFISSKGIQIPDSNKDKIEDFIAEIYYDRPFNYYTILGDDSFNNLERPEINVSVDFLIDEEQVDLVFYSTTMVDDKTHTIKHSEKDILFSTLVDLYST